MRYIISLILCFTVSAVSASKGPFTAKTTKCSSPYMANYTYDNGVWLPSNPAGSSTGVDQITILSGQATLSTNTTADTVIIKPGASLSIPSFVTLTVTTEVLLESVSDNYSSLILDGTIVGVVTYERYINILASSTTGGNDLISPPLSGERFEDFANRNVVDLPVNNTLRFFGPFDNGINNYIFYDIISDANVTLESGQGYRTASRFGTPFVFRGEVMKGLVNIEVSAPNNTSGKWNLIGNPYASYVSITDFFNHVGASGQSNLELLTADGAAIYGYNAQSIDNFEIVNLSNMGSNLLAPAQGFFITTDNTNVIEFAPYMRRAGTGDDFVQGRSAISPQIELTLNGNNRSYSTNIYFNSNASSGLDVGYDAKTWGGVTTGFMLYSRLVSGITNVPFAVQTLSTNQLTEEVVIPLGVHASAGEQLTFSLTENTTPADVEFYLEDTTNSTLTLLNTSDYIVTPTSNLSGSSRFNLILNANTLAVNQYQLIDDVKIYSESSDIIISGLTTKEGLLKVFDTNGREVFEKTLGLKVINTDYP